MNQKQKILAVDDEPRNLKILLLGLGDTWEIKTATNGEEAIEALKSYAPDVVLLDIMMPGIDGYEVCKRIRANPDFKFTKVILVSGKALLEERLKGYEIGADDYMTKPFIPEELAAKVKVFMRLTLVEKSLMELTQSLEDKVEERTQKLIDAEAKMVNSAKMSALGEMAGGIAHEINTPLATITLLTGQLHEMVLEGELDRDIFARNIKMIEDTTLRISKIILGLRTFSRDSSKEAFESHAIKGVVDSTFQLCREKFKNANIEVKLDPIPDNLIVDCRSTQLSQVLLNLLGNAADAVEELPEKWVRLAVTTEGEDLLMRVTDSGKGISADVQKKIFQPFFTTKMVGKGTGLGLSISKGLIEAHRGTLSVDAKSPNTCFVIRIPIKQLQR
jgi:C4-dicarboxylate-specific signal transduction histidine kinase